MLLRRVLALLWLALVVYVLIVPSKLFSQDVATGAIRGTVLDVTGARIPAASVVVVNQATGGRRGMLSSDDGMFDAQLLPPGAYTIRVEAAGMAPLENKNLPVELGSL